MSAALLDELRAIIQRDVNNRGLARDPQDNLFTACRDDFANACRSIAEHPKPSVVIVTGFFIPHAKPPCGETDGPLGAIFLARVFNWLEIPVSFLTDLYCGRALKTGLESFGMNIPINTLPKHDDLSWTEYLNLANFYQSHYSHLIAMERVGPGSDGLCRNMHGKDISQQNRPAHLLFEAAARQVPPLFTIGIGDGGNEIGMGKLPAEVIARNIPHGDRIACRVPTDHLIVAGVSNWGAYALAAGVALLRPQGSSWRLYRLPWHLFDEDDEQKLLRVMVEQGPLVDGVTAEQTLTVDGLAFDDYAEPLRQIGKLLKRESDA